MKRVVRWLLPMLLAIYAPAQVLDTPPVPIWPGGSEVPSHDGHYVFLTKDRHTLVVLAPEDPDSGIKGPKKIVRVPLWNDLKGSVTVALTEKAGLLTYHYSVANGTGASDEIGKWTLNVPPNDPSLRVVNPGSGGSRWWSGSRAFVTIAKQEIFPEFPLGRYLAWFYRDDHAISPGKTLDGFGLESSFLPGLTTAWFSSGKLVELDQSWPQEIFRDLDRFYEDRRWREPCTGTIAPMFAPDTPEEVIVRQFRYGLQQMAEAGFLSPSAPFVKEALAVLESWNRSQSAEPRVIRARPETGIEKEVAAALGMTLKIRCPE